MKTFRTSTSIRATPEAVWAILTDAPRYTTWNPTVEKIEGRIAPGEKVTVHAKINPGRACRRALLRPGQREGALALLETEICRRPKEESRDREVTT